MIFLREQDCVEMSSVLAAADSSAGRMYRRLSVSRPTFSLWQGCQDVMCG